MSPQCEVLNYEWKQIRNEFPTVEKMEATQNDFRWH